MLDALQGAIAVELAAGAQPRLLLDRPPAHALANALAFELGRHLSGLEGLGLCWMAGCFDAAQLLRPGWPVYTELKQLYQAAIRDPQGEAQVLTLSALRQQAPSAVLNPEIELLGGSLVYLPFVLVGAAETLAPVRDILEERLLDQGLVDARMARFLIDALEAPVEHARLLTRDDLCALTAANLEHAGLASIWQALEVALFQPGRNADVAGDDGLRCSVINGCVHLHFSASDRSADFADRVIQLRQAIAVLDAHRVPWRILPSRAAGPSVIEQDDAGFWIEWHGEPTAVTRLEAVYNQQSQLLWLELGSAHAPMCGHAFPLHAAGYKALRERLQAAEFARRIEPA